MYFFIFASNTVYLSPQSIQQCPDLQSVMYYTMKAIEAGEKQDGTVYNKALQISEKTTEILVAGGDPHFIRLKKMACDIKWMLHKRKKELYRLLDTTSYLRTDYRSLAEFLEIKDSVLESIEKESAFNSCTEAVIRHWTETSGKKMTLGLLYKALTHPGLVSNKKAANVIKEMMTTLDCWVCLDYI